MIYPIVCLIFTVTINSVYSLTGPNTCIEEHEVPVLVKVPAQVAQEVTTFKWCLKVPPRCKVSKIVYREGYKEEIHYEQNRTRVCCKGYAEAKNKCIPVCSNPCLHGRCISPEKCDCEPGWAGSNCDIKHTCPKGKKGKNCDQPCLCKNEARCDAISGECICRPGWTGENCSKPCPAGFHGFRCLDECKCQNGAECDPTNGRCKCKPGWKGQYCQIECTGNTIDQECTQGCYCDHGGFCNITTGLCRCPPGYTGDYCSEQCPYGTYGLNCAQKCDCNFTESNGVTVVCDHVSGCKVWSSAPLKVQEGDTNHASATLILLVGMIIIVLLISGFLILKYRRELRLLNNELAFVTYISRKESSDRFDNPLYAYQATDGKSKQPPPSAGSPVCSSGSVSQGKATNLFNYKNDLDFCKNNMEKISLTAPITTNDLKTSFGATGGQSSYEDLKTRREYQPNIYEESDNLREPTLRKEPVYAEIPGNDNMTSIDISKENTYDSPKPAETLKNNLDKSDNLKE